MFIMGISSSYCGCHLPGFYLPLLGHSNILLSDWNSIQLASSMAIDAMEVYKTKRITTVYYLNSDVELQARRSIPHINSGGCDK